MFKKLMVCFLMCLGICENISAQQEQESALKAAFIYNFTKYIDWGNYESDKFVIGVIGPSPVYESLQQIASTKTVGNKPIIVRRFDNPDDIKDCQLLFIPADVAFSVNDILSKAGKGTLTVSEKPGFAEMGVDLNFMIVNDKLRFQANVTALAADGLKASSQLLKLAVIIN